MRVLFISFATVAFLVLALFGVRQWGLMTPYQRFDHGFLDRVPAPHHVVKVQSLREAQEALRRSRDFILWLDLRMTSDGQFLILTEAPRSFLTAQTVGTETWRGDVLSRYSLAEVRPLIPEAPLLEDFLTLNPRPRMVLNVVDNATDVHHYLIQKIEPLKDDENFLFQSDIEIVLKSLKEKKPLWLYGSSVSDIMRILTFESLKLEPASPFVADVFVSGFELMKRPAFNEGVLAEVRRRQKSIFLGPLTSPEEVERARALQPDGFIYESLNLAP